MKLLMILALAPLGAPQTPPDWRRVPNPGEIVVEVDMASIHDRDGLRIADSRRSAPTSPRSVIMTVAIDCERQTIGLEGESRYMSRASSFDRSPRRPRRARSNDPR